jgi:hypothetical protein
MDDPPGRSGVGAGVRIRAAAEQRESAGYAGCRREVLHRLPLQSDRAGDERQPADRLGF